MERSERAPPPALAAAALAAMDDACSWTLPYRRSDRARMTHPASWAKEAARHARPAPRTARQQPALFMLVAANMQHTHTTPPPIATTATPYTIHTSWTIH